MQRRVLFTGMVMLGGGVGFLVGAFLCTAAILLCFTDQQREFMYGAVLYILFSGLMFVFIGSRIGLKLGHHLYDIRQFRVLAVLSGLGYFVTISTITLIFYFIFMPLVEGLRL